MKNKNAVKRGSRNVPVGLDKALKEVECAVRKYNALYGNDDTTKLIVLTKAEQMVEGTKAIAYAQQMEQDISCIALHRAFGFADERQMRYHQEVMSITKEFARLRESDAADDNETWYYINQFEDAIKAACGKYYTPREQRYHADIYFRGVKYGELDVNEVENAMQSMRGEQYAHNT